MSRLLHDRYLTCDRERVYDLVTGEYIHLDSLAQHADTSEPPEAQLRELFQHGQEGSPRWLVAKARNAPHASALSRRAAADARRCGYVPISVDSYHRLREVLAEDLRERTLLLIGGLATSTPAARYALLDAAALSPRPHLLLTFTKSDRTGETSGNSPASPSRPTRLIVLREARAAYAVDPLPKRPLLQLLPEVVRQLARAGHAADLILAGRHAAAERLLRDVAAALERRDAPAAAAQVLIALGRLHLERGKSVPADAEFTRAVGAAERADADEVLLDARLWQAAARTDGGRLSEAESICRAVLVTAPSSPQRQAWAEAVLARVLLWQGRVDETRQLAIACTRTTQDYDHTFAWIDSVAVRALLAQGRVFEAGLRSGAAIAAAETSGQPISLMIAHAAHLRVLTAAGDLTSAQRTFDEIARAARRGHMPLRVARARLSWAQALCRAGRGAEAQRHLTALRRMRPAFPPLLRRAIDTAHMTTSQADHSEPPSCSPPATSIALLRLAQEEESDTAAVRTILEYSARELRASRVDLVSCEAGPTTAILSVGAGLGTSLGLRILETGLSLGPEMQAGAREAGCPIRLSSRLIGAMTVRWPVDRVPPHAALDLISVAAAVAAPRVDGMLATARLSARAAVSVPELIGVSHTIEELRRSVTRAAAAPFAVLIEGESGVGKELVARAIHQLGARRERRFCDLNCAAVPDDLLESELFGHTRGAFTGAVADRAGLFEDADGGTLFLDELADLSPRAQAKLLRVLQQQEVRRVGETFGRKIDVRVIAAANREMRVEAETGRFRQDLLYRLDVIRVRIPPLREHPEDIPVLAQHFWQQAAARVQSLATLSPSVVSALARYHWPGNVRELQNALAALAVAAPARGLVRPSLLPAAIVHAGGVTSGRLAQAREQFERRFVEGALARAAGSRTRAARELGISRQGLLKIMRRLNMSPPTLQVAAEV